jgi:hypothetical protein
MSNNIYYWRQTLGSQISLDSHITLRKKREKYTILYWYIPQDKGWPCFSFMTRSFQYRWALFWVVELGLLENCRLKLDNREWNKSLLKPCCFLDVFIYIIICRTLLWTFLLPSGSNHLLKRSNIDQISYQFVLGKTSYSRFVKIRQDVLFPFYYKHFIYQNLPNLW